MDFYNTYGQTDSGKKEPLARNVSFKKAMKILLESKSDVRYDRLFVTDRDDCINFDWWARYGMTFPGPDDGQDPEVYKSWKEFFSARG